MPAKHFSSQKTVQKPIQSENIMTNQNAQNVIIKRRYFEYLKHADGKADTTINSIKASIRRFEKYTKHKNFKTFDR